MLKTYGFGEWAPDLAPNKSGHLTIARNCRPILNGYAPVGGFSSITSTLGGVFVGGAAYVGSDGTSSLLAATSAKLRRYSGSSWSDVLTVATTANWRFAQFGDNAIYANGGQLGSYDLIGGTAAVIATAPTNAIDVATVRDFVMCLREDNAVQWSGYNDSSFWTIGSNQADEQPLLDGGKGMRIFGGERGIILQRQSIRMVTYTGETDVWFQFDVIEPEIGCIAPGSGCQVGQRVFFLSERGFEMLSPEGVEPLGDERFNRWFFDRYAREEIEERMWAVADPRRSEVLWGMPGSPGRALLYNWVLKKATYLELNFSGLFSGRTANIGLDDLDAIYGDLDSIPISLDDPSLGGGNPLLLVVDSSNVVGTLDGDNLEATFQMANVEPTSGKRSRVRSVRPVGDVSDASVVIDAKVLPSDAESLTTASSMRSNGKMPVRSCNGRYLAPTLTIPTTATWSWVQGLELEWEQGEGR